MSAILTDHRPRSPLTHLLATLLQHFTAHRPTNAPSSNRTNEAEALREWASSHARHHRGFQDDLYAAADRHEHGG